MDGDLVSYPGDSDDEVEQDQAQVTGLRRHLHRIQHAQSSHTFSEDLAVPEVQVSVCADEEGGDTRDAGVNLPSPSTPVYSDVASSSPSPTILPDDLGDDCRLSLSYSPSENPSAMPCRATLTNLRGRSATPRALAPAAAKRPRHTPFSSEPGQGHGDFGSILLLGGVVFSCETTLSGFLVRKEHAVKYQRSEGSDPGPKRMELKRQQLRKVTAGNLVWLLECGTGVKVHGEAAFRVVGVARFLENVNIGKENFDKYADVHQTSWVDIQKIWGRKVQHCYGWHFAQFFPFPSHIPNFLASKGQRSWVSFRLQDLQHGTSSSCLQRQLPCQDHLFGDSEDEIFEFYARSQ